MAAQISVIIPVYNGEQYLAEAINSVLDQTTPASQIIVVDDGSTDATKLVAEGFGKHIEYIWQEPSGKAAVARNRGLKQARGEYLTFLDADDLWLPDKLSMQLTALLEENAELVFGQAIEFYSPEMDFEFRDRIRCTDTPTLTYMAGTMFTTRNIFDRVGLFSEKQPIVEFVEWYLRAFELNLKTYHLNHVVLKRRLHGNNSGHTMDARKTDYLRLLKASLDRRRAGADGSNPPDYLAR
jgi:glycosyltransferase involved in cell wall biosynthesis